MKKTKWFMALILSLGIIAFSGCESDSGDDEENGDNTSGGDSLILEGDGNDVNTGDESVVG